MFILIPKQASAEKRSRDYRNHKCKQIGWWTDCKLEPPCVWLEDIIGRGFPWGYE